MITLVQGLPDEILIFGDVRMTRSEFLELVDVFLILEKWQMELEKPVVSNYVTHCIQDIVNGIRDTELGS